MAKGKHPKKKKGTSSTKHPTVGHAYQVDEKTNLIFREWLVTEKWLPRIEKPDFFVDYSVEVVRNGEPTTEIFRAQLKGRSLSRRERNALRERFETKHLLYYLGCPQPVYLFLIDHATRKGFWVFAQEYIRKHWTEADLKKQGTVYVEFKSVDNMDGLQQFHESLQKASAYVRDLFPGTPTAAIKAVKAEYEELDSRYQVTVTATENQTNIEARPKDPNTFASLRLSPKVNDKGIRDLLERGIPLQIPATELTAPESPILENILKKAGNQDITISSGVRPSGSIQLSHGDNTLQINGSWLLAPKRIIFEGRLDDAPLTARLEMEADQSGRFGMPRANFSFDLAAWANQPIRALAHFEDLRLLVSGAPLTIRCIVKGNKVIEGSADQLNFGGSKYLSGIMGWLDRCRKIAARFGVNPPFPPPEHFPALETDDVVFLAHLVDGAYEQSFEGSDASAVIEWPLPTPPPETEPLTLILPNQSRDVVFLTEKFKLESLIYKISDLQPVETKHLGGNSYQVRAVGSAKSIIRIEMK
jgi:hypothetical protein